MTRASRTRALAGAIALAALLAACGGSSHTTTRSSSRTSRTTSSATTAATTTSHTHRSTASTTTTTTTPVTTTTSTTTAAQTTTTTATTTTTTTTLTTRTQTGPSFVGGGPATGALGAAEGLLRRHGFTPVDTATYGTGDTLHVLIGRSTAGESAFFFDQGAFIGTDAATPSRHVTVVAHGDSEVTLDYDVYAPGAQAPSGRRRVSFALDMGQLSALGPLPSAAARR